jgi:hypothetical protein
MRDKLNAALFCFLSVKPTQKISNLRPTKPIDDNSMANLRMKYRRVSRVTGALM